MGGLTYQCKLDSGAYVACNSGSITYSGLAHGSHTFQVFAIDSLGNTDLTPAIFTWTVDTIAPTVLSITSTATSPTKVSPIPVTITFSEPVCGFDSTTGVDLNVTNGTTGALTSGSNGSTVFTFNLSPSGQGLVSLYLMSGSVYDGNCVTPLNYNSGNSSIFSITYDTVSPTVTLNQVAGQADPTSLSPINFTATFSEGVTSFTGADVDLSPSTAPGTLSAVVTGGPSTYTVAVSGMTGDGTVIASIPAGAAQDAATNLSAASTSVDNTVTYIYNAPPVISEGASVTVTMSEDSNPTPFALTLHATDANFDPLTWSILTPASHGTAGVGPGTGIVSYTPVLNYLGLDSFIVQVSDGHGGTDSITINVTILDTSSPTVTNVTSTIANGTYRTGAVIPITITFSEAVIVTGTPQLMLETGAIDRVINYTGGSGTTALTFNYAVQPGDISADLDYVSSTALALNGGTIRDAAANDAVLTLPTPGAPGSLGANKEILINPLWRVYLPVFMPCSPAANCFGQASP